MTELFEKILKPEDFPRKNAKVLVLGRAGSHSYGTNIEGSDEDFRGVFVHPTYKYLSYLGIQEDFQRSDPYDTVLFDVRKFFKLAAGCNPNVLDLLFLDPSDYVYYHKAFESVLENRSAFLSKRAVHTFSGYARSQLARLKGHYRWLSSPPKKKPERADFGLPEVAQIPKEQRDAMFSLVDDKIKSWDPDMQSLSESDRLNLTSKFREVLHELSGQDLEVRAAQAVGLDSDILAVLKAERAFKNAVKEYGQFQDWKTNRNAARAELERRSGYDTKHAAHLVRLLKMCIELLNTGTLIVRRPDASFLLDIRNGKYSYDEIIKMSDELSAEATAAAVRSTLPNTENSTKLDELLCRVILEINDE